MFLKSPHISGKYCINSVSKVIKNLDYLVNIATGICFSQARPRARFMRAVSHLLANSVKLLMLFAGFSPCQVRKGTEDKTY